MPRSFGILCSSLMMCLGLAACSGSTDGSAADLPSGGANQASGASGSSAGSSNIPGQGGNTSSAGAFSSAGAGNGPLGSDAAGNGAGGNAAGGDVAGFSGGGAGAGGSSMSLGGAGTSGGGTGGKIDQSSLPSLTVHLAGDSTMSDYASSTTQEGWGQELGQYFVSKVTIDNQAQPGANVQAFYGGRWKTLIGNVKAGDYVMAAFGTNDSGTTHGPVSVADFSAEFSKMADEVSTKKATFILTTPSALQIWAGAKIDNSRLQPYCDALTALGTAKSLLVDDLNARGVEYYNMIGATAARALSFNGDKAHFDKQGATEMALLAAQELKRVGSPLAAYLK